MKNIKVLMITPAILSLCLGSLAFAADEIKDIKALEAKIQAEINAKALANKEIKGEVSKDTLSPRQVVIVNNGSSNSQDQKSEQKQSSDQAQATAVESSTDVDTASSNWGTGDDVQGLRQGRRSVEQVNEQVLMEKLEQSRIDDEKSRLDRLFKVQEYNRRRKAELGESDIDKSDIVARENSVKVKKEITEIVEDVPLNSGTSEQVTPTINYVVVPAATPLTPHAATSSGSTLVAPPLKAAATSFEDMFVRGIMAAGGYTEVDNVNAQTSWGLALGKNLSPRTFVEAQIVKAKFRVDDPAYVGVFRDRDLDQYNFSGVFGYKIGDLSGSKFQPHLRAGLSYVRRDSQASLNRSFNKQSSNSFDGIVGAGADFKVAKNLSITGTAEYYFNVLNDASGSDLRAINADSKIEDENYFILGVGLKLDF